ncbi:hypothetical protein SLS58_009519 [Diplodia intermedia]|uniref:Zn(2)-C6 fungal-type domain-containing protein n=1 Tax=Diplodia intermedia TaxID=856260 RepID=A0ABR3TC80_9PEZI
MLDPQCLSCKKRRVRCDTVQPGCGQCKKKGIDCPGYRKPLVWVNRTESDAAPPVQRRTKRGADGHGNFVFKTQRIKSSPTNDDDEDDGKRTRGDGVVVRQLARPPIPQTWPSADPQMLRLMNWAAHHNDVVAPTPVPDAAFVHMLQAPLGEWIGCQQAVQDLWVLLAMQHRVITAETNPQNDAEVCWYRVRSIAGLNRLLADPETQLTDDTLEAVMMLLMAECVEPSAKHDWVEKVQSNATNTWHHHLQGAATIVDLRGGWEKHLQERQSEPETILLLLFYDVMSSTTCNAQHLRKPLFSAAWSDYAAMQPHWEEAFSHDSSFVLPPPWPLFWSIIRINDVRASMARLNFAFSDRPHPTGSASAHDFRATVAAVLRHIRAFDPDAWFRRRRRRRRRRDPSCVSARNEADHLALLHCLRDAVALYCLRTLVVELTAPFRAWLDDDGGGGGGGGLLDAVFGGKSAEDVRRGCVRALLARLGFAGVVEGGAGSSSSSSSSSSSLADDSYAWCGATWPLFVAGYEVDGCGGSVEEVRAMRAFVAGRLRALAVKTGTWSDINAADVLGRVWGMRDEGRGPTWEEVFVERQVLVG